MGTAEQFMFPKGLEQQFVETRYYVLCSAKHCDKIWKFQLNLKWLDAYI